MTEDEFNKIVNRYLCGQASPLERELIDDFLKAQVSDTSSFTVSEEMWSAIQSRIQSGKIEKRGSSFFRNSAVAVALVLIVVLAVFFGAYYNGYFKADNPWQTVTAKAGEKVMVTLPDGSVVQLNSESSVSYPVEFASAQRHVILTGEAFFEVLRDEKKPFHIQSGNVVTTVLGTSFNIKAFPGENVSVTVATGKVQVSASARTTPASASEHRHVVLTPGKQAVYDPDYHRMDTTSVQLDNFLAWKNNIIQFNNTSLEEAALVLQRWYNITIEFENAELKNCAITGNYKDQSFTSVLESIHYMFNTEHTFADTRHVIIRGRGCKRKFR